MIVQNRPLIRPFSSTSIFSAAGTFGRPGMVMMSPVRATMKPAPAEIQYIRKWYDDYGFDSAMVIEAVNRTMERTHTPSFEYTDKILLNWKTP